MTELAKDEILSVEILESMPQSELEKLARKKPKRYFQISLKSMKKLRRLKNYRPRQVSLILVDQI